MGELMTNIEILILKGYNKKQIDKMTKNNGCILKSNKTNIVDTFNTFYSLGYSETETFNMLKNTPLLFRYKSETIITRFNYFKSKGYKETDIINLTSLAPELFAIREKTIDDKIDYYRLINIEKYVLQDPKKFRQSIELTYARHECLKSKGYSFDCISNSAHFYTKYQFERTFGIKTETLLLIYKYEDYLEEKRKNNRMLIRKTLQNIAMKKKENIISSVSA